MASKTSVLAGRVLMTLMGLATSISFLTDYNETHVFNPRWPPHARFHNGQTMSLGLTLGLVTVYLVWRPIFTPSIDARDSSFLAAVVASLYWATGLSAIWYPGTGWIDPEFGQDGSQKLAFLVSIVLVWAAYRMVVRGLQATKAGRHV